MSVDGRYSDDGEEGGDGVLDRQLAAILTASSASGGWADARPSADRIRIGVGLPD